MSVRRVLMSVRLCADVSSSHDVSDHHVTSGADARVPSQTAWMLRLAMEANSFAPLSQTNAKAFTPCSELHLVFARRLCARRAP